jgi:hypothetical protein
MKAMPVLKHTAVGVVYGAAVGMTIAFIAISAIGGILQVAPCHGGPSPRTLERTIFGIVFGNLVLMPFVGPPSAVIGSVIGGTIGLVRSLLLAGKHPEAEC